MMVRQGIFPTVAIAHPHVAARALDSSLLGSCLNPVSVADQRIQNSKIVGSNCETQTVVG